MKLNIKVSAAIMRRLPPGLVQHLVHEFAEWVFSDLNPESRCDQVNELSPLLIALVCKGEIGLESAGFRVAQA
jgi:hypothetical protein